jgi:hypothetical protein
MNNAPQMAKQKLARTWRQVCPLLFFIKASSFLPAWFAGRRNANLAYPVRDQFPFSL